MRNYLSVGEPFAYYFDRGRPRGREFQHVQETELRAKVSIIPHEYIQVGARHSLQHGILVACDLVQYYRESGRKSSDSRVLNPFRSTYDQDDRNLCTRLDSHWGQDEQALR